MYDTDLHKKSLTVHSLYEHIKYNTTFSCIITVVLLVFLLFCVSCSWSARYVYYCVVLCFFVHLSHLNKDYLVTYLPVCFHYYLKRMYLLKLITITIHTKLHNKLI